MGNRDDAVQRFIDYVKLTALDKPFISRGEERRLLEDAIAKFDLGGDDAQGVLLSVAKSHEICVERDIDNRIVPILAQFGGKRRKISRKKFAAIVAVYRGLSGEAMTIEGARWRVKRVMEENKFRPRRGGLLLTRRWYRRIGRRMRQRGIMGELPPPGMEQA
jgi:hypothetical protein